MRSSVSFLVLVAAFLAQAQPPTPPQQPPTFRTTTNVVRVDVTVLDHGGRPVTDLTKDDFSVTEDGAPQPIDSFKFVEATGLQAAGDELSLPIRSPEHAAAEAARDDVRVFVIFWDEYHIGEMVPATLGREALQRFVQTAFGPTDLVAITDPLTPSDAIRFTRDRGALADQVRKLRGRLGVYMPARSAMEEAQMYRMREIETLRSQVTQSALEATIGFLGTIKEGRKEILFVSQGFGGRTAIYDWLAETVRVANTNNTAIYPWDPRGVGVMSDLLISLANETGGRPIRSNMPANQLKQIVRDASAYYLLGYPSKAPVDGKFHKIGVHVNRKGLEVRARSGYFAPSLAELTKAKSAAEAAEVSPPVKKAITTLVPAPSDLAGDFWTGTEPGPAGSARVKMAWTPRPGMESRSVTLHVTGPDGHVYFDGPLPGGAASFDAPAGPLEIKRTVLASDGTSEGTFATSIEVPDFPATPLAVSTPVVLRARTGLDVRTLSAARDPQPYAGREFERTDRLLVRFAVTGTAASGAQLKVQLMNRAGTALSDLPFSPFATVPGTYQIDFPLGTVPRGEYIIAISAANGAQRVESLVPFRAK